MRVGTTALLALGLWAQGHGQSSKLNIAVNDLLGQGVERGEAAVVSERLRSELIATGVFRVMERAQMESILREQGFQKSGACDDASCIVEVGQLLGVERMVVGSLGRVAGLYTLNLRMINVATGEILYTVSEDCECAIKDVLSGATARAAAKLAQGAGGEVAKAAMAGKSGDLYVEADQAGASVEIDGRAVPGETPLTLQGFPAGEHRIVVRKGAYYGSQNVTLAPNDLLKVRIAMKRGTGSLKVFSEPPQVSVVVDGREAGKTPLKMDDLAAGEHEVLLRKEGYIETKRMVVIGVDETNSISATLTPAARIAIGCAVEDAAVVMDGERVGRGSGEYVVAAGEHEIQVESPDYEVFTARVRLNQGETRSLDVKLVSRFAGLKVSSVPPGARILLNENAPGVSTPFQFLRLTPGDYTVKVELEGYEPASRVVQLAKNALQTEEFTLEHTQVWKDSVAAAGKRSKKARQWARRIVFGVLGATCGVIGIVNNASAQEHYDAAAAAVADYDAARAGFEEYKRTYKSECADGDNAAVVRNIFYIAGGVFGAAMVISIPF